MKVKSKNNSRYVYQFLNESLNTLFGTSEFKRAVGNTVKMKLQVENYNGDTDLSYPLGVFSTSGDYLGIANNTNEYISLWNADANNQALGSIISGVGTTFDLAPKYVNTVINLYGLEYYTMTAPTNEQVFVDDNDIIIYGSTVKKGSIDGVLTNSDSVREFNPDVSGSAVQYHTTQFFFRAVNCTGYVDSQPLYIFHSRTSKVVGSSRSIGQYTLSGILPTGMKYFFAAGKNTLDYNQVTNWSTVPVEWFIAHHTGGGAWSLPDANIATNMNVSALKGIVLRDIAAGALTNMKSLLNSITTTIQQIQINTNNGISNFIADHSFVDSIPAFSELLYINNSVASASVDIDYLINTLGTLLNGITPSGEAAIRVTNSNVRTSASDTAYNALVAAGWTIILT